MKRIVLTDHPWADVTIERALIEGAGYELVAGGERAGTAGAVETLVAAADPVAILTCWAPVSARAVALPTQLAAIVRLGVGLDNIAVAEATARGAWVANVPDYCVAEVSDHAIALMMAVLRGIVALDRDVKAQGWHLPRVALPRLADLTIGIIGYGRIGRETARKLRPLGCRVLVSDPSVTEAHDGAEIADVGRLHREADVIVLHAPLSAQTTGMVDAAFLTACKRRPVIVNVSRGGLIDNTALCSALDAGIIRAAALDVVDGEPSPPPALLGRGDVVVTPHVAYLSDTSLAELRQRACEEALRVLRGEPPLHPCNQPVGAWEGTALDGGVSSDIRVITGDHGRLVVKRALHRLRVAANWPADPRRSGIEVRALRVARELLGAEHVPEVLWERPEQHAFGMQAIDPRMRNWKTDLIGGRVDLRTAWASGMLLRRLHAGSAARADLRTSFADLTNFHELRIVPYFERVAASRPAVAAAVAGVIDAMAERRSVLVHGDYSPKNMLVDGDQIVILDFEVAHWGDPSFDVAFCLSHLLLKRFRQGADVNAFSAAIMRFLDGYEAEAVAFIDDSHVARVLGCLLLARIDGDSPVDYLNQLDAETVRHYAMALLLDPPASLRHCARFAEEALTP